MIRRLTRALAIAVAVVGIAVFGLGADGAPDAPMPHAPSGVACAHCHEDPHEGSVGAECQRCHAAESWTPALFTLEQHAAAGFALEGRHAEVACASCHVDAVLTGLPERCAGCHLDRHRGKLGVDCAECHATSGFVPPRIPFDHAARTGFALTGPHAGPACADCHQGERGRAMRQVAAATCSTCHAPAHGDFGQDCAACHPPTEPTFAGATFSHRERTGFPLERRHAALGCADCHPVGSDADGLGDRCQQCHVEPHGGQLGTVCGDCHRPDRWRLVRFDHDRTTWPLRGRHFVASCASCHTAERWIGLGTACASCHAFDLLRAPATVPAHRRGLADCSDCHDTWDFRRP